MLKRMFLLMSLCFVTATWAQNLTKDTIRIESVSVNTLQEAKTETNIGARTSVITNAVLQVMQTQSLAELLSENSLVYIKSMGQGAMATSSFRGTSSSHTQVNWNGISINSPMLGNFDFSQVPILFTDDVTLYHGGGYIKGGTGALGGSINLNNTYDKQLRSSEFKVLSEYGSNATLTEQASARFSVGNLTSSTRLYYQSSDNDYKYLNKVLSKDEFYERRKNANYKKYGIMQQIYYDLSNGGLISANVWYQMSDRNLPPPIMVYRTSHEKMQTESLRSYVSYSKQTSKQSFKVTAAYLNDIMEYGRRFDISLGDTTTVNASHSAALKGEYSYVLSPKVELNATLNYRYDKALSGDGFHKSRNTISAQVAAVWHPLDRLSLDAQVMGEVNVGRCVPTYSVGAKYRVIDRLLSVKVSNSYNYRYPTLNDLYWRPGGNPNLKPEHGLSYDATVSYTPQIANVKLRFEGTYYRAQITDWIMWVPTNESEVGATGYIWKPQNFSRVLSQGVEIMTEASLKTGSVYHKIGFNYAYAPSVDRSLRGDGTRDKQLPYMPVNRWNARYALNWSGFTFNYCISFTDVRYTSADQSYSTNAYFTHDAELDYKFLIAKRVKMQTSLRVDNIMNAYYESTEYYPMPLRGYHLALAITF